LEGEKMNDGTEITIDDLPVTKHLHETGQNLPDGFECVGKRVVERWSHDIEGGGQALTEVAKCRNKDWATRIAAALNGVDVAIKAEWK
jgi:hypothetical protein